MDAAYISALAALAGSTIGGLTSFATSWLNQQKQLQVQEVLGHRKRRQTLYKQFIEEASRLYADALARQDPQISDLVGFYAMVSRMRVLSSSRVVEAADAVGRQIIDFYLAPNVAFKDLPQLIAGDKVDPLRQFSEACREDLQRGGQY